MFEGTPMRWVRFTSSNWSSFMRTIRPSAGDARIVDEKRTVRPILFLNFLESGAAGVQSPQPSHFFT